MGLRSEFDSAGHFSEFRNERELCIAGEAQPDRSSMAQDTGCPVALDPEIGAEVWMPLPEEQDARAREWAEEFNNRMLEGSPECRELENRRQHHRAVRARQFRNEG
jgi:hypothetical protein